MRTVLLAFVILALSGCGVMQTKPPIQATAPILVCPPPPNIALPKLKIGEISPTKDKGNNHKIEAYYRASIKQLKDTVKAQQKVLDRYKKLSKNYDSIAKQLQQNKVGNATK